MASEFPPPTDTVDHTPVGNGAIGRIKRILLNPGDEWPRIDAAPMTVAGILTGWVLPLAAIGVIASLVRGFAFPQVNPFNGQIFHPPVAGLIVGAVLQLAAVVGGVLTWSVAIDALAPAFKGRRNLLASLKLVAFSATAAGLCAIFQLSPTTWPLALLGCYSLYLFWVGVPAMTQVPPERVSAYVAVCLLIGLAAGFALAMAIGTITNAMFDMTPTILLAS